MIKVLFVLTSLVALSGILPAQNPFYFSLDELARGKCPAVTTAYDEYWLSQPGNIEQDPLSAASCYAHLHQWEKIIALQDVGEESPSHLDAAKVIAYLHTGKYKDAISLQRKFVTDSSLKKLSTSSVLYHLCTYLDAYEEGKVPLFPGFNGGLQNYLQKHITDFTPPPSSKMTADTFLFHVLGSIISAERKALPVFLELLADVVLHGENNLTSRWYSAALYFQAGYRSGDSVAAAQYETKALYALESDRPNPRHYNRSRFNKFKNTLREELLSGDGLVAAMAAHEKKEIAAGKTPWSGYDFLIVEHRDSIAKQFSTPPTTSAKNPFLDMINDDSKIIQERQEGNPNRDPLNRDIDKKEIKRNATYNFYAILLILGLITGALVIWRKLKMRTEELNRNDE